MRRIANLCLFCLILVSVGGYSFSQTTRVRFSTRQDLIIRMQPTGWSFRIPKGWLDWDQKFHNGLHLSRTQLEKIKDGQGEWDTEYGKVVNAALPFAECAVHVGDDGWGVQGASFGDLQMRGYVSDLTISELSQRISEKGLAAAKSLHGESQDFTIATDFVGNWKRITITYFLWYGDYGGRGNVEFYMDSSGNHSVVLVFMHAGRQGKTIEQILQTFSWN